MVFVISREVRAELAPHRCDVVLRADALPRRGRVGAEGPAPRRGVARARRSSSTQAREHLQRHGHRLLPAKRRSRARRRARGRCLFLQSRLYGQVELLDAAEVAAPAGHYAVEIVGTGFWNEALPLVRYRTGEVAIVPQSYSPSDLEDVALGLKPAVAIRRGQPLGSSAYK